LKRIFEKSFIKKIKVNFKLLLNIWKSIGFIYIKNMIRKMYLQKRKNLFIDNQAKEKNESIKCLK